MIIKTKFKDLSAGFTLIETLTTVLLFSFLVVIFGSVFVQAINIQRQAFNTQQVSENANFVLESMTKEIRVSQISGPSTNCPSSPVSSLSITHPTLGALRYFLSDQTVHREIGGVDTILSSNTVEFTRLQFCILGAETGDDQQPRVTILATARSRNSLQRVSMDLQTTVSQRFLND